MNSLLVIQRKGNNELEMKLTYQFVIGITSGAGNL
jgi:hypothetical protein